MSVSLLIGITALVAMLSISPRLKVEAIDHASGIRIDQRRSA